METELSNEELRDKLQEEDASLQNLRERVQQAKARISNNSSQQQTFKGPNLHSLGKSRKLVNDKPKTRNQLKKEINRMRAEWKSRKEKCMDFIDNLADAMEKRPKEVVKMLDIETDEMVGVKMPPKHDLEK